MKTAIILLFCSLLASATSGQVSQAGTYFGKIGSVDLSVRVSSGREVFFLYFDTAQRFFDMASGTVAPDGRGAFSAVTGRVVVINSIRDGLVSGTYTGFPFVATYERPFGPLAQRAFSYSGTLVDPSPAVRQTWVLGITVYPSGKALAVFGNNFAAHGGIGTISGNGVVNIPITNGVTWSFVFNPSGGSSNGLISTTFATGSSATSLEYFLIQTQRSSLINIATRGAVGGGNALTAGFVAQDGTKMLLIRAVGPTLRNLGVPNAQDDPVLTLYSGQTVIASNDDWGAAPSVSDIVAASAQVGAFSLANGSRDAVLLVTLEPGAYTAMVTGKSGSASSEGLVEVYEIR